MVQGIVEFKVVSIEPEKTVTISDRPYALPGYIVILPAILDELARLMEAEGIAVVRHAPDQGSVSVEMGRGIWRKWTGRRVHIGTNIEHLIGNTGQLDAVQELPWLLPGIQGELKGQAKSLTYAPLNTRGNNLGAIWLLRGSPSSARELLIIHRIADVVADVIYCLGRNHQNDISPDEAVHALLNLLAAWDIRTYQHSMRLVPLVRTTAHRLGCNETDTQQMIWATLLHDIGKIGVPKSILHKPGPLTDDEWKVMKLHPRVGARIVEPVQKLNRVMEIILNHHEKYDGSGYPSGIKGSAIPLGARILSVVDAYGAMTEERKYSKVLDHQEALKEIQACSGSHFDPEVSQAFIEEYSS